MHKEDGVIFASAGCGCLMVVLYYGAMIALIGAAAYFLLKLAGVIA